MKIIKFSWHWALILSAVGSLVGCANEPIKVEASRPVVKAVSKGAQIYGKNKYTPWGFGVCYGQSLNDPAQVLAFAKETCGDGRIELRGEDLLWNGCPMFQGARASFVCYPRGPRPSPVGG
ncbi:hypothetical protein WH96_13705 [Kiloniella spongiae]|uniref:Lipoprotein n=1 Tax=Kiloniella spongiae TaxID=1489064 RepID=A0A0H2MCZ0_9PROT|nr:hypothetical protein [Kiloniella spongiae]KLN60233.1 hypothetical protein WH96_13705 [Kiloniella spongiae]